MNVTKMTKYKRLKSHKGHSTHALSSCLEADDSTQKDYDWPIHSLKVIPENDDRENDNDE